MKPPPPLLFAPRLSCQWPQLSSRFAAKSPERTASRLQGRHRVHADQGESFILTILAMQGFDEFMNVVLDDAEEVWTKDTKARKVGERQSLGALTSRETRDPGCRDQNC